VQTWNPLRLLVLKAGLTEPAWTSPWNYQKKQVGTFTCAYCGQELFDTDSQFDSGSGWPSFWRSTDHGAVRLVREFDGRVECSCSRCKSHLGHVFMDGPRKESLEASLVSTIPESDPKGRTESARLPRFCVNGASLRFAETDKE
jgi:peptide-methionine (R)-S-oxide reductase